MDGITIPLASPIVAERVATPPVIDGTLNDACWLTGNRANIVPGFRLTQHNQHAPGDRAYTMIRYDDTNLYNAGGL